MGKEDGVRKERGLRKERGVRRIQDLAGPWTESWIFIWNGSPWEALKRDDIL